MSALAKEADGARKLTAATRTVLAESAAWGAIATLADGSLGLTYQVATPIEGTNTVHVAMVWVRSTDGGKTWSKPVTIYDHRGPDGKTVRPSRRRRHDCVCPAQSGRGAIAQRTGRLRDGRTRLLLRQERQGREEELPRLDVRVQPSWSTPGPTTWGRRGRRFATCRPARSAANTSSSRIVGVSPPLANRHPQRRHGRDVALWIEGSGVQGPGRRARGAPPTWPASSARPTTARPGATSR